MFPCNVLILRFYEDWRRRNAGMSNPTSSAAVCLTEACGASAREGWIMGSARTAGGGSPAAAAGGKRRRKAPVTVLNRLGRAASEADCCATGVLVAGGAEANRLASAAGDAIGGG